MKFSDVFGQDRAKDIIRNAVSGNRLSHAILFRGREGIGKMAFVHAVAQYVNCEQNQNSDVLLDSCGECGSCRKISQLIHPDVHLILPIISKMSSGESMTSSDFIETYRELFLKNHYLTLNEWVEEMEREKNKQTSISISEIRNLKRTIELKSFEGRYKVVIIWHAEKIRTEAANAFLKILEEPPEDTLIFLTIEDPSQLLGTILSRCQMINMERLQPEMIKTILLEEQISPEIAEECAALSDGALTQARNMAKHTDAPYALAFMNWLRMCFKANTPLINLVNWSDEMSKQTKEYQKLYFEFALQRIRDALMYYVDCPDLALCSKNEREGLSRFGKSVNLIILQQVSELLEQTIFYLSRNINTRATLIDICLKVQASFSKNRNQ